MSTFRNRCKRAWKAFVHRHEYRLTVLQSPTRAVLNLTCAHCGQEWIFRLTDDWETP